MGNRGLGIFLLSLGSIAACSGEDNPYLGNGDDVDASVAPDADPNAPDADPNAPDADPNAPDADTNDGLGPTFTVISPGIGSMVSGVMTLVVDIEDFEGVVSSSVVATIAGTHTIDMELITPGRWGGTYDTTALAGLVFPTIVVRAEDVAGNPGQLGFEIVLDNQAPIASLDPPNVREGVLNGDGDIECSASFDPVGDDAADDGARILQLTTFRARVQDLGNSGTMTTPIYIPRAGVDTVELYVLDDTTRPLVVDSNADGSCDDINPEIVPTSVPSTSNEAAVIDLVALDPAGSSYFTGDMSGDPFTGSNAGCVVGGDNEPPTPLCAFTYATRIPEVPAYHEPMIYAIPPVQPLACMGYGFDALATSIADGWACVAVKVTDLLGNARVSAPLRVCVDSNDDGVAPCTLVPTGMPNCTGTYTPSTGAVTSTACTPRVIPSPITGGHELLRTDI